MRYNVYFIGMALRTSNWLNRPDETTNFFKEVGYIHN
jgi:hypothetical protein